MPGKLTYFGLGGRAESIRAMLAHKGFDYEDDRIDFAKQKELAETGVAVMGFLPLWEEDGFTMCQCNSIMRMLGIRLGYYAEDPQTCYNIDSLCDFQEDILNKFGGFLFPKVMGKGEVGTGSVDRENFFTLFWNKQIAVVEGRLAGHGKPFVAGTDRPTIADFKLFGQVSVGLSDTNSGCVVPEDVQTEIMEKINAAPNYAAWRQRMKEELSEYLAKESRPL